MPKEMENVVDVYVRMQKDYTELEKILDTLASHIEANPELQIIKETYYDLSNYAKSTLYTHDEYTQLFGDKELKEANDRYMTAKMNLLTFEKDKVSSFEK